RGPVCRSSGRCCRFEQYGHRLYVTAAELGHFARVHGGKVEGEKTKDERRETKDKSPISLPVFFEGSTVEGCPYQVDGLCAAREARPLGCRVYFCDENAQGWQQGVYE